VYCFVYCGGGRKALVFSHARSKELEHAFALYCRLRAVEQRRQRIWDAQRTGLRNRLRDQWRLPEDRAERLLAEWESEAAVRGLSTLADGYWATAETWVTEQATGNEVRPKSARVEPGL
jgi:hypothetical protein